MAAPPTPRGRAWLLLATGLGLLAACDGSDAPDDAMNHPRAPEIARIVPVEEALANTQVARLDPAILNDAEIRLAVGNGALCLFRYTSAGNPVLALGARPGEPLPGGVVKLNGTLVRLDAAPYEGAGGAADRLLLTTGPIRIVLTPDPGAGGAGAGGVARRREADMIFAVGEGLRVGYRGYLDCGSAPPVASPR